MLKNKLSDDEKSSLISVLSHTISTNKTTLQKASFAATNDPPEAFRHDFRTVEKILSLKKEKYDEDKSIHRKPKGKVLLLLSYNEPLLMSVDPVFSALAAGNEVFVRASSAATEVLETIWKPAYASLPWLNERLTLLGPDHSIVTETIPHMNAVYLFGSQHVATLIASQCAKHLVEFWPETEGADFAVYTPSATITPHEFAVHLAAEAVTHSGQICQRLQGAFVHRGLLAQVYEHMITLCSQQKNLVKPNLLQRNMRDAYDKLAESEPNLKYMQGSSANSLSIVTGITAFSPLCQQAFFLPAIWLIPYESEEELLSYIASRPIQFGCNLWTEDTKLIQGIAQHSRLTRITLNTEHTPIRNEEGWGGAQPTSFGGYMGWNDKFTNAYTIISN